MSAHHQVQSATQAAGPDRRGRNGSGAHHDHAGDDGHDGHDKHAGHDPEMFRRRFWWSLLLTVPLVVLSPMVQEWFGYSLEVPGQDVLVVTLGTALYLWAGWPFLAGGLHEVRDRQPGMMLLISLAVTVAYVSSLASSLGRFDLEFWWELGALETVMLLGHWQEMKAIGRARGALDALAELLPDEAERLGDDGEPEVVHLAELARGDVVLVRPGGRVPADGEVVDGEADVDESMITGESRAVPRGPGESVVAGTVSTDGTLRVRVAAVGEDTALAGIRRLVGQAQEARGRTQALADRAAAWLFWIATGAGVVTFATWSAVGEPDQAVVRTVSVLVIACPHALGLAIPLVISLSTAVAADAGILVKDRLALERMRTVDAVLFDKTGTLTRGEPAVTGVAAVGGGDEARHRVLALAAAVESDSEHPLARAVLAAADERGIERPRAEGFRSSTGRGVQAEVEGRTVAVGGPALLADRGLDSPGELADDVAGWSERGATVLHVLDGDEVVGALALEDEVRPESRPAVDELHEAGVRVVMVTGDARHVAEHVADDLGVDEVRAEVLPEDKGEQVTDLQARGQQVAMVGDGVNDAPALAAADVGIAIGAGTDVAIESAGVVLASDDPRGVVAVRRLSTASYRKMRQNLVWAAGYNVVAIPLAGGALAWAGIVLPPAVGAVLMSLSTVVVALNAQLLRRVDLRPVPLEGGEPGTS